MSLITLKVTKRLWITGILVVAFFIGGCARHKVVMAPTPIGHQDACSERTVFVGDMGNDENVPRFRILLEKSLREEGFTVLPDRQQADITLSGVMSVGHSRAGMFGEIKTTQVYTTLNVETSQGLVHTIDISATHGRGDHVAIRAQQVAEVLLQACRQRWKEK